MDFIPEQEIVELLRDMGVTSNEDNEACVILEMDVKGAGVRDCLCVGDQPCEEKTGWNCRTMNADQLVAMAKGQVYAVGPPEEILTEQMVSDVFGLESRVIEDPVTGKPMMIPLGRHGVSKRHQASNTERAVTV